MFRDKLRELRLQKGYTMEKLAEEYNKRFDAKLNKSTLSRYENGLQEPMMSVAKNMAELFDVSLDYISDNNANPLDEQLEGIDFALWGETRDLTDEEKQDILDFVKFKKSQRR